MGRVFGGSRHLCMILGTRATCICLYIYIYILTQKGVAEEKTCKASLRFMLQKMRPFQNVDVPETMYSKLLLIRIDRTYWKHNLRTQHLFLPPKMSPFPNHGVLQLWASTTPLYLFGCSLVSLPLLPFVLIYSTAPFSSERKTRSSGRCKRNLCFWYHARPIMQDPLYTRFAFAFGSDFVEL